jgi:hypothetical protein
MFLSEAVESAKCPHTLHESKALNMGIAEIKPHHLAHRFIFADETDLPPAHTTVIRRG